MAGAKRRERCVRMTENKGKWASRHRKIEKLGCQAAAKIISFPRRWHGGMISANQEAIWGMSVYLFTPTANRFTRVDINSWDCRW